MIIDKVNLKIIEDMLYKYFEYIFDIEALKRKINLLENQIHEIDNDIKNTNVKIDYYQKGIGLSERVQTSRTGISYAEAEFEKAIEDLEKEQCNKTKEMLEARAKLREKESFIENMEKNINIFEEEDKSFIELKYRYKKSIPAIAMKLNIAQATAYRKREKLIRDIAEYMNIMELE